MYILHILQDIRVYQNKVFLYAALCGFIAILSKIVYDIQ